VCARSIHTAARTRPTARSSRAGSDGPLRDRRAGGRDAGRRVERVALRGRLDGVRLLPDERALGRDRV
jgi:hypothetical protein